jgi:hypothetical protein
MYSFMNSTVKSWVNLVIWQTFVQNNLFSHNFNTLVLKTLNLL